MDTTDTARIVLPLAPAPAGCPGRTAPAIVRCPQEHHAAASRTVAPTPVGDAVTPGGWWAFCSAAATATAVSC